MNNSFFELQKIYNEDKILSAIGKLALGEKMGLSPKQLYLLQKKELRNKYNNSIEINIDIERNAKDIMKEINRVMEKIK